MKLLTKAIKSAAEKQYAKGSDMKQDVVAKFFNPCGAGTWYLMNKDPKDGYCWGICIITDVEMGSFMIDDLQDMKLPFYLTIERDRSFKPQPANKVWEKLLKGEHV